MAEPFNIDTAEVRAVLVAGSGWHPIRQGSLQVTAERFEADGLFGPPVSGPLDALSGVSTGMEGNPLGLMPGRPTAPPGRPTAPPGRPTVPPGRPTAQPT